MMKSICYVVPYFGKLPGKGFQLWLTSCGTNPTIDWLIFTDDKTAYDYPKNVKVTYCSFDDMRKRLQQHFNFPIILDRGWKLCDFRPSYGEIFEQEFKGYDYWGHCDIDLMWGNIREYYTDELLEKYEKIGHFGHSTLYKNTPKVNARYKIIVPGLIDYKKVFSSSHGFAFDEVGIEAIYQYLNIPYYIGVDFANLTKYEIKFHLGSKPKNEEYKNYRQIFTWKNGALKRHYLADDEIHSEDYLYIHFWCRPMSYKVTDFGKGNFLIYSDVVTDGNFDINKKLLKRRGKGNLVLFYIKSIWKNRKKLTPEKIIMNIKGSIKSRKDSK